MRTSLRSAAERRGKRDFCIDNLLVRIHFIIVMIRWTGLAPWAGCHVDEEEQHALDGREGDARPLVLRERHQRRPLFTEGS